MPQIRFNWVDILFITLLIRICYIAFKNGLLPEFFRFSGLLSAFIFSFNNYILLSDYLSSRLKIAVLKSEIAAFLFIFILLIIAFRLLSVIAAKLLGADGGISLPNKILGFIFGLARGILLIGLIYTLFIHCPVEYISKSAKDKSFSSQYISKVAAYAYRFGISFYPWKKISTPLVKMLAE